MDLRNSKPGIHMTRENTLFKVLHFPSDLTVHQTRNENASKVMSYFSRYLSEIESPVFAASKPTQFVDFFKQYPNFKIKNPKWERGYKVGNVAIWASNYILMKEFLKTDAKYIIVLEDDVWFQKDLYEKIYQASCELPNNFDYFSFWAENYDFQFFHKNLSVSKIICRPYQRVSKLVMIYSRFGAEKIVAYAESGIDGPGDIVLFSQREIFNGFARPPSEISQGVCTKLQIPSTHYFPGVSTYRPEDFVGVTLA
jgi:GR25 family glycosyltransferase involved in LPS biosynthesis